MMQQRVHYRFSLEKLSQHSMNTITDASRFDYRWWKAEILWHSVDAHFHDGARSVSPTFFHINAANKLSTYRNDHIAFELPDLQDQKLLTLCWCSISEWCGERDTRSFAYNASQYPIYV